ncbi:MAG: hypothetical protein LBR82_00230 [Desulfovibrio sp.]|jgi:hypothetical protein|nr:hypothetical protein [Desulfovibrio sp.]
MSFDKTTVQAAAMFFVRAYPEQEADDYRTALRNRAMRRIFRSLLSVGNVFGPSMGNTENFTAYNEGIRAMAIRIATKIEQAKPGEVARLMAESVKDRTEAAAIEANTVRNEEDY